MLRSFIDTFALHALVVGRWCTIFCIFNYFTSNERDVCVVFFWKYINLPKIISIVLQFLFEMHRLGSETSIQRILRAFMTIDQRWRHLWIKKNLLIREVLVLLSSHKTLKTKSQQRETIGGTSISSSYRCILQSRMGKARKTNGF